MSESASIERLRALRPPPESPDDVRRSMNQILARLAAEGLVELDEFRLGEPRLAHRRQGRRRLVPVLSPVFTVIAAVFLITITILVLTPAGNAVANWIGDVIGVGQPGGQPTLNGPPEARGAPWQIGEGYPTVIAVFRLSDGTRAEIVAWRNRSDRPCLAIDITGEGRTTWHCLESEEEKMRRLVQIDAVMSAPLRSNHEAIILLGRVRPGVTSLSLSSGGEEDAVLGRVKPSKVLAYLRDMVGVSEPFNIFAFMADKRSLASNGLVRAFGPKGQLLGAEVIRLGGDDGDVVPSDSSEVSESRGKEEE